MTEEIEKSLNEILARHICSLKRTSKDEHNKEFMCDSNLKVVHFDKIPSEYGKITKIPKKPCSNDALYISNDEKWYFIEFKNGTIEKNKIYRKIYDSLLMLLELNIIQEVGFSRKNINYILVYNSEKCEKSKPSKSRDDIYNNFLKLAKQEKKLFEIEKLEGYLFKETHTYSKEEFEKCFVIPMEQEETEVINHADKM